MAEYTVLETEVKFQNVFSVWKYMYILEFASSTCGIRSMCVCAVCMFVCVSVCVCVCRYMYVCAIETPALSPSPLQEVEWKWSVELHIIMES